MPKVRKHYSYVEEWKRLWEPDLEAIGTNNGQTTDPTRVDPKVLQWVKDHCVHMPHFVKIINPNAAHGRPGLLSRNASCMGVPGPFVKQHFRELDRVITLEQDDGRKWKVAFGAPQNYPKWNQGWDRFARDKNLKSGDVVVFVLVRNSCFHFTLFDADGNISEKSTSTLNNDSNVFCKKEIPSSSSQDQPFVSNPETEQHQKTMKRLFTDHLSAEPSPEYKERDGAATDTLPRHGHLEPVPAKEQTAFPTCKERQLQKFGEEFGAPSQILNQATEDEIVRVESPHSNTTAITPNAPKRATDSSKSRQLSPAPSPRFESLNPLAFTFKSRRRTVTPLERQRAREMAMARTGLIPMHYFMTVMSETHVYRDFHLVLPNGFGAALKLPACATRLKFLDGAGHSWDMYSKKNASNQFALHRKYWALFALHHLLEEGDVCVFALKEEPTVRTVIVHIFRVVPIAMADVPSVHAHYETHKMDTTA